MNQVFPVKSVVSFSIFVVFSVALEELHKWKAKRNKKPLIIRGARQVGKTWLMKEFSRVAFEKTVYISFDNNQRMKDLFSSDLNVKRIVRGLELYSGHKIDPVNALLIFEIQEVSTALTLLKYQIVRAGSLLGVALHQGMVQINGVSNYLYMVLM